jgi:hypothetical protein
MMERRVSELEGAELDYWVAKAVGRDRKHDIDECEDDFYSFCTVCGNTNRDFDLSDSPCHKDPRYTKDWRHGGPIIEREAITIIRFNNIWGATAEGWGTYIEVSARDTWTDKVPLIAAMRCFVASKFGATVTETKT